MAKTPLPEGFELREGWLQPGEADAVFEALLQQVRWEGHRLVRFGRPVDSPRRSCWICDAGAG
ncbi:MAG: alpha-ketoglutarate-dependent dioxygenase AlkB, partial [Arenimonas caeni]|nr:alpha-ketoglutarate-dependent dioxygenase AlkB [Arenimonas caeni]